MSIFLSQLYRGLIIRSSQLVATLEDTIYGNLMIAVLTALVYGIFTWGATTLLRRGKHPNWYLLELILLWFWPIIITIGLLLSLEYGQPAE
jgi:hypothetical protein|tara:strand:+ start:2102 stop:2374 length:273 start_codon:yes stop_codon:yes gene_type:complete